MVRSQKEKVVVDVVSSRRCLWCGGCRSRRVCGVEVVVVVGFVGVWWLL